MAHGGELPRPAAAAAAAAVSTELGVPGAAPGREVRATAGLSDSLLLGEAAARGDSFRAAQLGAAYDDLARRLRRGAGPGAGFAGSGGALAGDFGTAHDNPGALGEHLRRLLPFVAMVASSAAVTGLADGTASPAERFGFFALLLGGMSLVMIHVLRA